MIKAIIFDCFGVLTTDLWKEFCASLPPDQVEPARELNRRHDAALIDYNEFVGGIEKLTGRKPPTVEDPASSSEHVKNVELLAYIKQLKPSYKIGLLSNIGSDWIQTEFLTPQEINLFDAMVLSYQIGVAKPDPKAYEITLQKLGTDAQFTVLVDDSPGHCAGAEQVGIKAIQYQNFNQMKTELEEILAASSDY